MIEGPVRVRGMKRCSKNKEAETTEEKGRPGKGKSLTCLGVHCPQRSLRCWQKGGRKQTSGWGCWGWKEGSQDQNKRTGCPLGRLRLNNHYPQNAGHQALP